MSEMGAVLCTRGLGEAEEGPYSMGTPMNLAGLEARGAEPLGRSPGGLGTGRSLGARQGWGEAAAAGGWGRAGRGGGGAGSGGLPGKSHSAAAAGAASGDAPGRGDLTWTSERRARGPRRGAGGSGGQRRPPGPGEAERRGAGDTGGAAAAPDGTSARAR